MHHKQLPVGAATAPLIRLGIFLSLVYSLWWLDFSHAGNPVLYGFLFAGEVYHVLMTFLFWYTVYPRRASPIPNTTSPTLAVDVFVTVAGEPTAIVEKTVSAAVAMHYPHKTVYILNDGFVRKSPNWKEIESLAKRSGAVCITRKTSRGAKAGNINNALSQTTGDIVCIFDADMVPEPDFLTTVLPYFTDPEVGFVQTPQYYTNHKQNAATQGAWDQQMFFFGPVMNGKNTHNASFICGTNVAIRRKTLASVGGINEQSIAEDFLTSLLIHEKGWKSAYHNEVLASGLAPHDLPSYISQQFRWARGSLVLLFSFNPLFKKVSWQQKFEYLASTLYYCHGIIVLIDLLMPLIYLGYAVRPVTATTSTFAFFFLPYIIVNLITLYQASDGHLTFRAISFSFSSFALQIRALIAVVLGTGNTFTVTPKTRSNTNPASIVSPHVGYILLVAATGAIGIYREGLSAAVVTNIAWAACNIALFLPFIHAAVRTASVHNDTSLQKNDPVPVQPTVTHSLQGAGI